MPNWPWIFSCVTQSDLRRCKPQSAAMRTLISLTEHRRELVADKTRFTNRLTNTLKQYYPQALDWFDQRDTVLFCDFLTRWPTLTQVKRAHQASLKAFFHAHNGRVHSSSALVWMPSKPLYHSPKTWASSPPVACTPWCWSSNCALALASDRAL